MVHASPRQHPLNTEASGARIVFLPGTTVPHLAGCSPRDPAPPGLSACPALACTGQKVTWDQQLSQGHLGSTADQQGANRRCPTRAVPVNTAAAWRADWQVCLQCTMARHPPEGCKLGCFAQKVVSIQVEQAQAGQAAHGQRQRRAAAAGMGRKERHI